jgi:catechol 2,3-dioxygenase-like lactoylglutathione lyase family enzyme
MNKSPAFDAFSSVTVGVADMDGARLLWVDTFGMEVVADLQGPDAGIARLWGIEADDIAQQLLLRTGNSRYGMLHLVEFESPDPPVRRGAAVFDQCPKNLDIYVDDLPKRVAELKAAGRSFRNDNYSEVTAPNGITFREIHMPAHDDINVVLLQVIGRDYPFSAQGYAAVGPLITIVGDADAEKQFYQDVFGLQILSDNVLDGPEIERMVGLPPGAALDVSIWGREDQPMGQMELIDYRGVDGNNLYPLAKPKALGILHITYVTDDLLSFKAHLDGLGIGWSSYGRVDTLMGSGEAISVVSPAGLRIDVQERNN